MLPSELQGDILREADLMTTVVEPDPGIANHKRDRSKTGSRSKTRRNADGGLKTLAVSLHGAEFELFRSVPAVSGADCIHAKRIKKSI
jgi:hypothetical protein